MSWLQLPLRAALDEIDATDEVHVVFGREASDSVATVVDVGSYSALAGGALAGVGALVILGAAAMGEPAHDYSDVMVGGAVTFLVGTGVATIGGLTALGGHAARLSSPRRPLEQGSPRERIRPGPEIPSPATM